MWSEEKVADTTESRVRLCTLDITLLINSKKETSYFPGT